MNDLAKRMKDAGMIPLEDILEGKSLLGGYDINTHVKSLDDFEWWLKSQHENYTRGRISMELDKSPDHDLYEWILAHQAAFHSVYQHFIAAKNHEQNVSHETKERKKDG